MRRSSAVAAGVAVLGLGTVVSPSAAEAVTCGPTPYTPTSGFGGVGGRGVIFCEGHPDGVPDYAGTVRLEYQPLDRSAGYISVENVLVNGDAGVTYDLTAFEANARTGYYRTVGCIANGGGGFCVTSSEFAYKP